MVDIASAIQSPQANAAGAANALMGAKNKAAVKTAATKFEAMFMQEMVSHMYEGMDTNGPFSGGHGEEVFRSLMVEEYGKKIAASNQTGIAPSLEKQMLKMQEEQQHQTAAKPGA